MAAPAISTRRHSSAIGDWEMRTRQPSPVLRGLVTSICGYSERTPKPFRRREMPSNDVVLILNLGPDLKLLEASETSESARMLGSFAAGLDDSWSRTEHCGESLGIEIRLSPLASYRLFGIPMCDLSGEAVDLEELFGGSMARALTERLAEITDWEHRFGLIENILVRRIFEAPKPAPEVEQSWRELIATNGMVRVSELVTQTGWSHRHLTERFREQIGMTPKRAARLVRFNRAVSRFERDDGSGWADIALECGYSDQSHLNRDFRAFAGASPSEFIARRLPDGGGFSGD